MVIWKSVGRGDCGVWGDIEEKDLSGNWWVMMENYGLVVEMNGVVLSGLIWEDDISKRIV